MILQGEKFLRGFIFGSHFFNIFRGFNFANWLSIDFLRGFTLVLSIFFSFTYFSFRFNISFILSMFYIF